jgi:hypothetical protein
MKRLTSLKFDTHVDNFAIGGFETQTRFLAQRSILWIVGRAYTYPYCRLRLDFSFECIWHRLYNFELNIVFPLNDGPFEKNCCMTVGSLHKTMLGNRNNGHFLNNLL